MVEPIGILFAVGVVGLVQLVVFVTNGDRKVKRRLRKAPRRSIRHLPDRTYARFSGTVLPIDSPLVAPLTGRPCTFWRVIVLEKRGKGYGEVLRREAGKDFSIRDDSGTLLVRVTGAKLAVEIDGNASSGVWRDPSPELERFLAANGEETTGWILNRQLRCNEAVIEEGESVTVAGVVHAEPDPEAQQKISDYRETPMRMILDGARDAPVLITDDPDMAKKK
jgi:hypothetical protein